MKPFVTLLMLAATAVAIPVPQQQQQIPMIPGQNGFVALVPVSALSGFSALSATPQQQQGFWPSFQLPSNLFGGGSPLILVRPSGLGQSVDLPAAAVQAPTVQSVGVATPPAVKVSVPVAQAPVNQPVSIVTVPEVKVPVPVAASPPTPKPAAAPTVSAAVVPTVVSTSTTVNKPASATTDSNTDYNFVYQVNDPITSDSKSATETRQGDTIKGTYIVNDPDGRVRTVSYIADPVNGFQAKVDYKPGNPIPQPTPEQRANAPQGGIPQGLNAGASASAQVTMGGTSYQWNSKN